MEYGASYSEFRLIHRSRAREIFMRLTDDNGQQHRHALGMGERPFNRCSSKSNEIRIRCWTFCGPKASRAAACVCSPYFNPTNLHSNTIEWIRRVCVSPHKTAWHRKKNIRNNELAPKTITNTRSAKQRRENFSCRNKREKNKYTKKAQTLKYGHRRRNMLTQFHFSLSLFVCFRVPQQKLFWR